LSEGCNGAVGCGECFDLVVRPVGETGHLGVCVGDLRQIAFAVVQVACCRAIPVSCRLVVFRIKLPSCVIVLGNQSV
jgi:hypothetical protein